MIKAQVFKTFEGASKRARFENAHCGDRYHFAPIRFWNDKPDTEPLQPGRTYTWRLSRTPKGRAS